MPSIGLWTITSDGPVQLPSTSIDLEQRLEDWIERDPSLLQTGFRVVGRQMAVETGRIDLLALDPQGRWVVIEIKAGSLYRETVAQALDYAACIAAMPYEELAHKVNAYLSGTGASLTLEALLRERHAEETPSDDRREVLITFVGTGRAPGLERMVNYLSARYDLPISIVSYEVFASDNERRILVRELTGNEDSAGLSSRRVSTNLDSLCDTADRNGIGREFRLLLDAARRHDLYPRVWKSSVMYAPQSQRTRCLYTVWVQPGRGGTITLWVGPKVFAEFFSVTAEEAESTLGREGYRNLDTAGVYEFIRQADTLFQKLKQNETPAADALAAEIVAVTGQESP